MSYREEEESLRRKIEKLEYDNVRYREKLDERRFIYRFISAVHATVGPLIALGVLVLTVFLVFGLIKVGAWLFVHPPSVQQGELNARRMLGAMNPGRSYRLTCGIQGDDVLCHYRLEGPVAGAAVLTCSGQVAGACR